jgi:hypothetical protein
MRTHELYDFCNDVLVLGKVHLSHNGLSIPYSYNTTLFDHNIHQWDTIQVSRGHGLLGGSSVYSHVAITEKEVVASAQFTDAEWLKATEIAWEKYEAYTKMKTQSLGMGPAISEAMKWTKNEHIDFYVKLAEDCLVLLYMLGKSTTRLEVMGAIGVYAKLRTRGSLSVAYIRTSLTLGLKWFFGEELQATTSMFAGVQEILGNYDAFKHSVLAEKLHCFMLFALGHSLFDSIGMKVEPVRLRGMCDHAKDRSAWKSADFAYLCLESMVFICERGIQSYQMGSIQPMFHSGKNHEQWLVECQKLKTWSMCLGNPDPHGFTIFQYQNELEDVIEKGDSIVKVMAILGPREKQMATQVLNEMKLLKASLITTNDASKDRIEPFGVLIAGGSSVMKTTFSKICFYHYGKTMGLPTTKDYRYVRNPLDDYWSGFKSYKWCVQLDDIAAFKPAACNGVDPSVAEALQILNTVAYVTNQAELNDKGRVPMRARLVTATTNVFDLNAFAYYENDLAPRRRFPLMIKLEMKPEYTVNGMVDPSKVPEVTKGYHNVWNIKTYRVVAAPVQSSEEVPKQRGKLQFVREYNDIEDFLADFSLMTKRHFEIQTKAEKADDSMEHVELCPKCYRTSCACMRLQAGIVPHDPAHHGHHCGKCKLVRVVARLPHGYVITDENGMRANVREEAMFPTGNYPFMRFCPVIQHAGLSFEKFDSTKLIFETEQIQNVSEAYFDVLRERNKDKFGPWFLTFFVQWFVHFGLHYRVGRAFAGALFGNKWTREVTLRFFIWLIPSQFMGVLRLTMITVNGVHARHPRLVNVAVFCSAALMTYWAIQKVTGANKPAPVPAPVEEKDDDTHSDGDDTDFEGEEDPRGFNSENYVVQVGVTKPPVPHAVEYENVWNDHDAKQVRFSVSDMSASWAGLSWDNVHELVKWNLVVMELSTPTSTGQLKVRTRALCVKSRMYILNRHAWNPKATVTMYYESSGKGVSANLTFPASSVRFTELPSKDLVAIEVTHAPVRKNLVQLFPKAIFTGSANGMYVVRHPSGTERVQLNHIHYQGEINPGDLMRIPCYMARASRATLAGECGSPMFGKVEGAIMLMGIHVAGHESGVAAISILQSDIAELEKGMTFTRISTGGPAISVGQYNLKIGAPHFKSHTNFEAGCAVQVGGDEGFRPKSQSKVAPTILAKALAKRGISTDKCAPNLRSWKPFSLALKDLLNTNRSVDTQLLHECAEDYVRGVLGSLKEGWESDAHFYDLDTAINGADGVAYVDAINKNTSAGAPCNRTKRNFLKFDEASGRYTLTKDMEQAVTEINEEYANKRRATPVFMAHLKDQAIPLKKVEAEKVRVFVGGPMAWTIAVRQRLLWFIRLAQCNRIVFELGAGTIAQSTEWGDIYKYLTAFGKDRIVAGDFGKFDKRMGSCFILYAYWIIVQVGEKAGMDQDALDEIWCVAEDTAFAFTNFNGDLLMFMGSNPSGHPLTVIVNSLVNSLYMRYVYRQVAPQEEKNRFKDNVHLYTYGDDNIMGVRKGYDWFNHTVISQKLALIGVEYTMADKESESVPFIDIDDASFLKRKWRYDEEVGAMMATLEEASIEGSLLVGIVSKDMTPQAHAVAVMQGSLNEYFFYGKDVFEEKKRMLEEVIEEEGLTDWAPYGLRKWDECLHSFRRSSAGYERVRDANTRERVDSSGLGEAKTTAHAVTDSNLSRNE